MGNVITCRTHVVLCLVVALVFAIKISKSTYWWILIVFTLILHYQYDRLDTWKSSNIVSFTLAVNNHSSGWLNFENTFTICQLLQDNAFLCKYFRFLSLERAKTQSHATLCNTFASAVWKLLQENEFILCPIWAGNQYVQLSVLGRSVGSLPEQRLAIEPIMIKADLD